MRTISENWYNAMSWHGHESNRIFRTAKERRTKGESVESIFNWMMEQHLKLQGELQKLWTIVREERKSNEPGQ